MLSEDKEVQVIKYGPEQKTTQRTINNNQNGGRERNSEQLSGEKLCLPNWTIFLIIITVIILIGIIVLIVLLTGKNKESPILNTSITTPKSNLSNPYKFETEFDFVNKLREPYRIKVEQKYVEEINTNGIMNTQFVDRKTNYDIFIINETNSTKETKNFYDKIYTAAILISSQCIDTKNDKCEPQNILNLEEVSKKNLRNLMEIPDLKDIPIPLCLFNITDNDVITSVACHKSLQSNIKQSMILDLYFFRPPAIKRPDKEGNNVTITKNIKDGKEYIRETNGGICDVPDAFLSFCTTEMNTTKDLKGNILSYDEIAFSNITHGKNNFYIKNKITNLKDETEKISNIDINNYQEILNGFVEKLSPHLEYYEEFSVDNFKELYKISKNISDKDDSNNPKRNLNFNENEEQSSASYEILFNYTHYTDINFGISLINDLGYKLNQTDGMNKMKSAVNLTVNGEPIEINSQQHNFTNFSKIVKKLRELSKSGNLLATELYNNIQHYLDIIDDVIYDNITNLIKNIMSNEIKSISSIFDSSSNLGGLDVFPLQLVQESINLKNKLNQSYNFIENGGMKSKLDILNKNIYSFLTTSHKILDEIFPNVKALSNSLKSTKSKLTEIATFYSNYTSDSYSKVIEDVYQILLNYFNEEEIIINSNITLLIDNFNNKLNKSIENELKKIDDFLEILENEYINIDIENENSETKPLLISNLKESKNIINSIKIKVEELIKEEMDLKENGHFLTEEEISLRNNTNMPNIIDALEISKILDNDETRDKVFDKTYGDFRENYTKLVILGKNKIQNNMIFLDDATKIGTFSDNKTYINTKLTNLDKKISESIDDDNKKYIKLVTNETDVFIQNNIETLKELYNNLISIFSDDYFNKLSNLYKTAFESCLKKIDKDIEKNKNLIYNYFSNLSYLFNNDTYIFELLKNFEVDELHLPHYLYYWSPSHYVSFTSFYDIIKSKSKTTGYLNKYKKYKEEIELEKNYINQELQFDLKYEYKTTSTKIKELLQRMKNSKLSERFSNYAELKIIDDNINNLDDLYKIINNSFSDKIYNEIYPEKLKEFQKNSMNKINKIDNDIIEAYHSKINKLKTVNDYSNDFCIAFLRKKTYTCTNGVIYHPDSSSDFCEILKGNENNQNKLISFSIYSEENLNQYLKELDRFLSKINNIVSSYTSIINNLSQKLYSFEQMSINQASTPIYYQELKNLINNDILYNIYGNNMLSDTYEYFQKETEQRINTIFGEILIEWQNLFSNLYTEVSKNFNNYKKSISEFGLISITYNNYFYSEISESYFELINTHEKREFNYTLSYYYNYLVNILNSERQNIISKFPKSNYGYERVLKQRENEINQLFDELINNVKDFKNKHISKYNQLNILQVNESDFFNNFYLLSDFKNQIKAKCETTAYSIFALNNGKNNDLYSYISRFYLENSENGKQIIEFYKEVNEDFIYLEANKFNSLIQNNWDLKEDQFAKLINVSLSENNAQISEQLEIEKEDYKKYLENEIIKTKSFIKENIVSKISYLYNKAIKELKESDIKLIQEDINEIIRTILFYLSKEKEDLKNNDRLYKNDFSLINQTIKYYKEVIISNMNKTIYDFIGVQEQLLEKEIYENYYEKYLNDYLNLIKEETKGYEDIHLLNSSYNFGKIINKIANELTDEYKNKAKYYIINKHNECYENIYYQLKLDEIQKNINSQIEEGYSELFLVLHNKSKVDIQNLGYTSYDLSSNIKNDIDEIINNKYNTFISIINSLKDEKYNNININTDVEWEVPNFTNISNIIDSIKISFDKFLNSKKKDEDTKIELYIKQAIEYNFNDLFNNLVPSFGNEFFERIIEYNENFKIRTLFDNLEWGVSESISYIEIMDILNQINQITKDLKLKIYKMNDIDTQILKYNNIILDSLKKKSDKFISDSIEEIINKYEEKIINNDYMELYFSPEIVRIIKSVFSNETQVIENDYREMIEKYLKEKLIEYYKIMLEELTEGILKIINNRRSYLKTILDDIDSIDPDDVLNEINSKKNITNETLSEYKQHLNQFKISNELVDYLYNFVENEIYPPFLRFKNYYDTLYKDVIILNLDKNSDDYKNLYNYEEFEKIVNNTYNEIQIEYINNIISYIDLYCENYTEKLESKINSETLRNLNEEYIRKIPDKSLDYTFNKLFNYSSNLNNFIQSLEKFDEFDKKINDNIKYLDKSVSESSDLIFGNNYTKEIKLSLDIKLDELKNHTLEYYSKISESFDNLKIYLKNSISKIEIMLNNCANVTIKTFEKKYSEILDNEEGMNLNQSETIENYIYKRQIPLQNFVVTLNVTIKEIKHQTIFNYNVQYDKNFIKGINFPKVNVNIINLFYPKKAIFRIDKPYIGCLKEIEIIEIINFNKANYTTSFDFSPNSRDIISTTSAMFDDISYTKERYNTTNDMDDICSGDGENIIRICYMKICSDKKDQILINPYTETIEKKEISKTIFIPE